MNQAFKISKVVFNDDDSHSTKQSNLNNSNSFSPRALAENAKNAEKSRIYQQQHAEC